MENPGPGRPRGGLFGAVGRAVPILAGLLFVCSGVYKLLNPGQATLALESLEWPGRAASLTIFAVTVVELYLGVILLARAGLRWGLGLAAGLLLAFTGFLFYLSLLAHPPSCGCLMLTGLFESSRDNARLGVLRNCLVLWGLKVSWDWHFGPGRPGGAG